jgi:hypothetical protein
VPESYVGASDQELDIGRGWWRVYIGILVFGAGVLEIYWVQSLYIYHRLHVSALVVL